MSRRPGAALVHATEAGCVWFSKVLSFERAGDRVGNAGAPGGCPEAGKCCSPGVQAGGCSMTPPETTGPLLCQGRERVGCV